MKVENNMKRKGIGFMFNIIGIKELPMGDFEEMRIHAEPRPGALTKGPSQPVGFLRKES